MSDMWQVPDDLADRVRDATYKDAWEREIERTVELRAILTDLIAELREAPHPSEYRGNYSHDAADRAEARLQQIGDAE